MTNFTKSLVEMMYFRPRNSMKTKNKKKIFAKNWSHIFPEIRRRPKKKSLPEIEVIFPPNQVKTNKKTKKVFAAICDHFWQEICRILKSWQAIFFLVIQRSTLDGRCLNLDRRTLNLEEGTLTFDGGTRPPYNLSTAVIYSAWIWLFVDLDKAYRESF